MVQLERSASTYVAVAGLLVFGTITSLLAKIGVYFIRVMHRLPHLLSTSFITATSFACGFNHANSHATAQVYLALKACSSGMSCAVQCMSWMAQTAQASTSSSGSPG